MSAAPAHGSLATRLASLQQEIDRAVRARLAPGQPPVLIGASKTQPVEVLEEAIRLGLTDFGENRVQEAQAKWPALKAAHPSARLHLIGPLQSNKAEEAVALFDVIQTIDRPRIADAVAAAAVKLSRQPECLIQVNTGEEAQKAGVMPKELGALVVHCRKAELKLTGLMCIPPMEENPAPHFALLHRLATEFGLSELSMGMSQDFASAIRLGATCVRIGTRLFGPR